MFAAIIGVLMSLPSGTGSNELPRFYGFFMVLFTTAGIGNGSVFRMVPTVFQTLHKRLAASKDQTAQDAALKDGEVEASVALGFTSAIAALGMFFIPAVIAISIDATGTPILALSILTTFYATCIFATWWWYWREEAEVRCD